MQYKLVVVRHPENLEKEVNRWLAEDWKPMGGVATSSFGHVMQALVKYGNE